MVLHITPLQVKNWQSKIQLLFTLLGLTIDTTAAYLAPSNQVGPVLHSLVHKSSGDDHNYNFHSEGNKWLRKAIDRAKQSITVPPNTSNPYNRIRSDRQVPYVFNYIYILFFQWKRHIWEIVFLDKKQHSTRGHQQPYTKDLYFRGNDCKRCNCSWASSPGNHYQWSQNHTHFGWCIQRIPTGIIIYP